MVPDVQQTDVMEQLVKELSGMEQVLTVKDGPSVRKAKKIQEELLSRSTEYGHRRTCEILLRQLSARIKPQLHEVYLLETMARIQAWSHAFNAKEDGSRLRVLLQKASEAKMEFAKDIDLRRLYRSLIQGFFWELIKPTLQSLNEAPARPTLEDDRFDEKLDEFFVWAEGRL
jgi:hypothetical protein